MSTLFSLNGIIETLGVSRNLRAKIKGLVIAPFLGHP
jgi:hypothetical protein